MIDLSSSETDKKTFNQQRRYHSHPRVRQRMEVRLEQAKNQQPAVFFVDAAHFVFPPFLGYLWCLDQRLIRVPSGRQRFNVLGALNAITDELVTVTN